RLGHPDPLLPLHRRLRRSVPALPCRGRILLPALPGLARADAPDGAWRGRGAGAVPRRVGARVRRARRAATAGAGAGRGGAAGGARAVRGGAEGAGGAGESARGADAAQGVLLLLSRPARRGRAGCQGECGSESTTTSPIVRPARRPTSSST